MFQNSRINTKILNLVLIFGLVVRTNKVVGLSDPSEQLVISDKTCFVYLNVS